MNGDGRTKEAEGGCANVRDGFARQGKLGVKRFTTRRSDCKGNTFRHIGFHTGPVQPSISGREQCLTGGWSVCNERCVICKLEEISPSMRGKGVSQVWVVLGDGVHQGVHHGVEDDHSSLQLWTSPTGEWHPPSKPVGQHESTNMCCKGEAGQA